MGRRDGDRPRTRRAATRALERRCAWSARRARRRRAQRVRGDVSASLTRFVATRAAHAASGGVRTVGGPRRGDVLAERFDGPRARGRDGAAVLLKGVPTVISSVDGQRVVAEGTPVLATAGRGDVLGGIAVTLLAQNEDAALAGALAAWVHGRAAEPPRARARCAGHARRRVAELRDVWGLDAGRRVSPCSPSCRPSAARDECTSHTRTGVEFDAIRELLARWGDQATGIGDDAAVLLLPGASGWSRAWTRRSSTSLRGAMADAARDRLSRRRRRAQRPGGDGRAARRGAPRARGAAVVARPIRDRRRHRRGRRRDDAHHRRQVRVRRALAHDHGARQRGAARAVGRAGGTSLYVTGRSVARVRRCAARRRLAGRDIHARFARRSRASPKLAGSPTEVRSAAIDLSDGLVADARHLARASDVVSSSTRSRAVRDGIARESAARAARSTSCWSRPRRARHARVRARSASAHADRARHDGAAVVRVLGARSVAIPPGHDHFSLMRTVLDVHGAGRDHVFAPIVIVARLLGVPQGPGSTLAACALGARIASRRE